MVAPTPRFSPFDQRQTSSLAAVRNAPGRSAASPDAGYSAGRNQASSQEERAPSTWHSIPRGSAKSGNGDRNFGTEHPHVHGEQHDDATSQAASSTVGRRLVPDADARRMASAVPVAEDIERLAARLRRGAQDARRIADNAEILSRRLQRDLPHPSAGLDYAVNEHAELSDTLADAHAFVVRCATQPKLPEILAALECGEDVVIVRAHDASVLFSAADNRPARAGVVGDDVNPTSRRRKLWSGIVDFVSAGHRKSSSPASHVCPPVREQITTDGRACASKNSGYRNQGRRA